MQYLERATDRLIPVLLEELPALLIVGPRAVGKTTTASRHAATTVRLDQPGQAAAFKGDPDAALKGLEEPVLLDEWQATPQILGAVKRAIDSDSRPGRYLITGSVRADLEAPTWPGTGRLVRVAMFGLTMAERLGRPATVPLLDRLARSEALEVSAESPDLRGYLDLALQSGFPEAALSLSESTRARWIRSYIDQLVTRDAMNLEDRDPAKLRRFFEVYALNSAGIPEERTLYETAGIDRKTMIAYERLLVNLMVIERVQPWASNRLKRLVRSPKRYLIDSALLAGLLRMNASAILRDGNLLGRVLETFVVSQLRTELDISETLPRLYYLRQEQGRHEIDLIAEYAGQRIAGIEVKADAAPGPAAAKHLIWLRDQLGDRFISGVILHTGPGIYELGERILAAPIASIWG